MVYVYPDFYSRFKCIASECRHSCCIGWEIDIDEDTMQRYNSLRCSFASELKDNIALEPQPHFVLSEGERCPFLRQDGLCRLILELGEEELCDICSEHPRFYNEFSSRLEAGLGLCCEEAARLLLDSEEALSFVVEDDGEDEEPDEAELKLLAHRDLLLDKIGNCSVSLYEMLEGVFRKGSIDQWADFYMTLERLDSSWTEALQKLKAEGPGLDISSRIEGIRYRRIAAYFIYRHFPASDESEACIYFALLSTAVVCCLEQLGYELADALRMYSSEIEYSDENVEIILEKLK